MLKTGALHAPPPASVQRLSARASLSQMAIPASADWFKAAPPDGDALSNDQFGCCVECADFRLIELILANLSDSDAWKPTVDMVLARYAALTGFDATTGSPDDGTDTAADLTAWCSKGILLPDLQRDVVPFWVTVDPLNDDHLAIAMAACPLLVTLSLPDGWQAIEDDPTAWSRPPGAWTAAGEGHRVLAGKFSGTTRWVRSWGNDYQIDPTWWQKAVVAVDMVCPADLFGPDGVTITGLDRDALAADMRAVAA